MLLLSLSLLIVSIAKAQLSGTYTISSNASQNPDYASFSAAVTALSDGLSGQVVFEVAPGTYEEFVTIPSIQGASASNRVVFRGMGADNQQIVLTSNAGYTEKNTLTLDGADYISFENLTLQTTSTNYANVVYLDKGVVSDYFINVRFVGYDNPNGGSGYVKNQNIIYDKSQDVGNLDSDLQFKNCSFTYGDYAFYMQGPGWQKPNDTHLLIEDCTFTNQRFKSIYVTYQEDAIVRNNTFENNKDVKEYWAIDAFRCYYGTVIENNVINANLSTVNAEGIIFRPGTGSAERPIIVRNNMISIRSNDDYSYGIYVKDDETSHLYISHNTVKLTGTGSATNLFVDKSFQNLTVNNNIFINETPGYVFRYQSNDVTGRVCDYNRISFTGEKVGRLGSTDYATLAEWQADSGYDTHTALCAPSFVSDTDLHLTASDDLTLANPLSYVTTDIDDEPRANTPCAGADEYTNGVNLPPIVLNTIANVVFDTYPAHQTIDLTNTFDDPDDPNENIVITVFSNSNPDLVGVVLNNRTLQIQRLQSSGGTSVIVLQAVNNGQSVQTFFSVECVAEDLPPVVINALSPISFNAFPEVKTFDISACFDDPDNNNEMMEYSVQNCPVEISAYIDTEDMLRVSRTTPNEFSNKTLVIRATSNGKFVDMSVNVSGTEVIVSVEIADFEDVELGTSGIWQPEEGNNQMLSGGWIFTNYYSSYFWGGFTASNRTDLTQTGMNAQFTAVTGCGYDGSAQYAVAYTMGAQTEISAANGEMHTITGCYVTNNLWAYQNMLEGDAGTTPFGGSSGNDPDWFKLTATGKKANGQVVGTLDFYLADFRFANNEDDYILNTWEWFDLSPLGEVASVSFSLSSTKVNNGGMITPAYFCMDNFNGNAADLPPYIVSPVPDVVFNSFPQTIQVDLNGVATDPDDPDENIVYSIVSNSNGNALSATMNGKVLILTRQNHNQAEANLVMCATSNGQTVDFNIHVVINAAADLPPVIANPVEDVVFEQYPQTIHVDLNAVATDPDDPDENIVYSVVSNSNSSALVAQVDNKDLVLGRLTGEEATADLTMRATSNGQHVDFNIHVVMIRVTNQAPYIVNPVPDVVMNEFPMIVHIDLDGVATDDDDPDELIEYELVSNSNEMALAAVVSGKVLALDRLAEEQAEADVELRAISNGQSVNFNVHVTINQVEGLDENRFAVVAYPNPTEGWLTLSLSEVSTFNYRVFDLVGQCVMSGNAHGEKIHLDFGSLNKGIYFISIGWRDSRMIQKVIVQ